jgi:hypothetical protein
MNIQYLKFFTCIAVATFSLTPANAVAGDWQHAIVGATNCNVDMPDKGCFIWTAESDNYLYRTEITYKDGDIVTSRKKLHKDFKNTSFMFYHKSNYSNKYGSLFTIQKNDGKLYKISGEDGTWCEAGTSYKHTSAGAVFDNTIYTTQSNSGQFYRTTLKIGECKSSWVRVGDNDSFGSTKFMYRKWSAIATSVLFTTIQGDNVYEVNGDGGYSNVGTTFKYTIGATMYPIFPSNVGQFVNNYMYTVQSNDGCLYHTNLLDGASTKVGSSCPYSNTKFGMLFKVWVLIPNKDEGVCRLISIDNDGKMYSTECDSSDRTEVSSG